MIILIIRKSFECVSIGIGSDKHSVYVYLFNCMVAWIFGLVKERRDFLFCVSEDVKRRDFWGSILKACYEVVWGLVVGVERKILFLRYLCF